jgi:hypothetical protein
VLVEVLDVLPLLLELLLDGEEPIYVLAKFFNCQLRLPRCMKAGERVGCAGLFLLGLLLLADVELLGSGLALGEGITMSTLASRTIHEPNWCSRKWVD